MFDLKYIIYAGGFRFEADTYNLYIDTSIFIPPLPLHQLDKNTTMEQILFLEYFSDGKHYDGLK